MGRQLPAYSPLSPRLLARAAFDAARSPQAAREALRRHLAERFAADHVVLTSSGTEALRLALELANAGRPARDAFVALPAYSCYDVLTAAVGAAVKGAFYDIDPASLTPEMESLARVIDAGATTVVAGNLFGFPLDWHAVRAQCERAGVLLVEDAAQGLGSGWGTGRAGSFGDLAVLSFGRGKGWTGGGGGALLVRRRLDSEALARLDQGLQGRVHRGASARAAVVCVVQWAIGRPLLYGTVAAVPGTGLGETRYREPTDVAAMAAFCASAALRHAELADGQTPLRRRNAGLWESLLATEQGGSRQLASCTPLDRSSCGYLRYPGLGRGRAAAEALSARARGLGVARGYPVPLPRLPAATRIERGARADVPGAHHLADALVTLPTHRWVDARNLESVRRILTR